MPTTKKSTTKAAPKRKPATRSKAHLVRVTPDEHAALTAAAARANRKLSDYMRLAATYCATHKVAL